MTDKKARTDFHATIRKLFDGTFETFARDAPGEEGARIAIKWGMSQQDAKRKQESWERQKRQKDARDGESHDENCAHLLTLRSRQQTAAIHPLYPSKV
jgi:hypothetical protein